MGCSNLPWHSLGDTVLTVTERHNVELSEDPSTDVVPQSTLLSNSPHEQAGKYATVHVCTTLPIGHSSEYFQQLGMVGLQEEVLPGLGGTVFWLPLPTLTLFTNHRKPVLFHLTLCCAQELDSPGPIGPALTDTAIATTITTTSRQTQRMWLS